MEDAQQAPSDVTGQVYGAIRDGLYTDAIITLQSEVQVRTTMRSATPTCHHRSFLTTPLHSHCSAFATFTPASTMPQPTRAQAP